MRQLFSVFLAAFILQGCSSTPTYISPRSIPVASDKISLRNAADVKEALYEVHDDWEGTDYQYGGLSRSGVDCSGFIYITFRSGLGVTLPRTTAYQSKLGKPISKNRLKAGDLVFFKTSRKVRHVGVYVEKGMFLHASTSRGVMLSRLDNPYWRSKYWMARRL